MTIRMLPSIFFILSIFSTYSQKTNQYYEKIVGTWIERDSDNGDDKWVFKADKTAEVYYDGKLFAKYESYEIVRTSKECGHTTYYDDIYILKMKENTSTSPTDYKIENVGEYVYDCSYINGITEEIMSLSSTFKGGPPLVLLRQTKPILKND